MVALSDLIQTQSLSQVQTTQLALLALAGFPTTSWQSNSVPLTLINANASMLSGFSTQIANVAAGGLIASFLPGSAYTPASGWLDLIASSHYQLTRKPATAALGWLTLTDASGGGPYTITPLQLYAQTSNALLYQNQAGGVIPKNGQLVLSFQAAAPGAAYDVANNTITQLATPLPGVTVTNVDPGPTFAGGGLGTWLQSFGVNAEADQALATRCQQKWATIGGGANAATYSFWATSAASTVTRVQVVEAFPTGGQVSIYCGGPVAASPPADVTTVNNYIQPLRPLCVKVNVAAATNYPITIAGTVFCTQAQLINAQAQYATNLTNYSQGLGIGATVYVSKLIDLAMSINGVQNIQLTSPALDTNLAAISNGLIAVFTNNLVWVGV